MNRLIKSNLSPLVITLSSIILVQAVVIIFLFLHQKRAAEELIIRVKPERAPAAKIIPKPRAVKVKIAIVLDDWGYTGADFSYLDKIDVPLTLSILPGQKFSQAASRYARQRGWQAILHLPLEPQVSREYSRLEPDTILTSMSEAEIKKILNKQIKALPYIVGVSNHMGSKVTASEAVMRIILRQLRDRELFFLDSLATSSSVCKKLSKEIGVGFVSRDVFLDNEPNQQYILGQFEKLIGLAKSNGSAVGIGHDRKATLIALAQRLANFDSDKEGVEFVLVSELVRFK